MRLICWVAIASRASGAIITDMTVFEFIRYTRGQWYVDIIVTHVSDVTTAEKLKFEAEGGKILTRQAALVRQGQ